jgi:Ca-activated chloride channel family protein
MTLTHPRALLPAFLLLLPGAAFALNISLAQIDASRLLFTQNVQVYVSVTDNQGLPVEGLEKDAFSIAESSDGVTFQQIPEISAFTPNAGAVTGMTFLLLIDDSGSMYDTLDSRATTNPLLMRIAHAKDAVRTLLAGMTNPGDRVGLAYFNTGYHLLSRPTTDREKIAALLDEIQRPTADQAYTELYASLTQAAHEFAGIPGRKAIIVLSDGENYPYAVHAGKAHPVFGSRIFAYGEPITANQEEGNTVYAVNFGTGNAPDRNLRDIALQTGGKIFDARNRDELASVYDTIHRQVAGEYLLTYRATLTPAEKKYVRASIAAPEGEASVTRFYFASTVFGLPLSRLTLLLVIPFVLACLLLWGLTLLRLERKSGPARLEVLHTQVGRPVTRIVPLTTAKTVIGGSPKADMTIVGAPRIKEQHATILFDPKNKSYTVVGTGDIMVNNQPVKTRTLEPGDVLDIGGATIVFDDDKKEKR